MRRCCDIVRLHLIFAHKMLRMRTTSTLLALLGLLALANQCRQAKYTADNLPDEYLRFGNGGGFAGTETTYILLDNGQLFKSTMGIPEVVALKNSPRKTAKQMFETVASLGLEKLDFAHPGNTYSFIEYTDDGKTNRVTWGSRGQPVDEKIRALYEQLVQLTKQ